MKGKKCGISDEEKRSKMLKMIIENDMFSVRYEVRKKYNFPPWWNEPIMNGSDKELDILSKLGLNDDMKWQIINVHLEVAFIYKNPKFINDRQVEGAYAVLNFYATMELARENFDASGNERCRRIFSDMLFDWTKLMETGEKEVLKRSYTEANRIMKEEHLKFHDVDMMLEDVKRDDEREMFRLLLIEEKIREDMDLEPISDERCEMEEFDFEELQEIIESYNLEVCGNKGLPDKMEK
jgi:hypothetical protein